MEKMVEEMKAAAEAGYYFVALITALAIPDICGALGAPNGLASGPRYKAWVRANMGAYCEPAEAEGLYKFRCSLLHQGTARPKNVPRFIFQPPGGPGTNVFHNLNLKMTDGSAVVIDIQIFCYEVAEAATAWLTKVGGTEPFEKNYAKFVRVHPQGIPPYVVGMPVIG